MPFIAKTDPIVASRGDTIQIEERPYYGGREIEVGADLFLWSSETQRGEGLWGRGTVAAVIPGGSKPIIRVRVEQLADTGSFGIAQVAPHRNSTEDTAIVGLARKLYKHSLNKVARITEQEAALFQPFFASE